MTKRPTRTTRAQRGPDGHVPSEAAAATTRDIRRALRTGAAVPALLLGLAPFSAALAQTGTVAQCPWLNTSLPIATRVNMLMQKMTIADEVALVEGNGSSEPYVFYIAANPTLCIPALGYEDGPEGVADALTNVTQLPASIALAATFSQPLALQYGAVIGAEQSRKGSAADLGPTVNIDRDPRWGRTFESLSEDPQLTALIDEAEIVGIQGQDVQAQVKHFDAYQEETNRNTTLDNVVVTERVLHEIYQPAFRAAIQDAGAASLMCAYSSINGEYSCQDRSLLTNTLRNQINFEGLVMSDYGAIHDIAAATAGTDDEQPENTFFGEPLQAAVTSGMIARATLNSMVEPILSEAFRFNFFNAPPTGTVSAVATTPADVTFGTSVAEAGTVLLKNAGNVLPLAPSSTVALIGPAASAQVTTGGGGSAHVLPGTTVTPLAGLEAETSGSVTYTQGLPTDTELSAIPAGDLSTPYAATPYGGSYSATLTAPETGTYIIGFTNPGSYTVATLALNGTAIINNPGTPPVAVYTAAVQLTAGQTYSLTLGGAGPTSNLVWATPSELSAFITPAVAAAKAASTAVVVVGDDTETEAADRPNLQLPSAQDALIEAVAAANPHTVVVVQAGAPITMPWLGQVSSVLDTWYPGQTDGTALADVIYGRANPSGHLPITFPASLADVPAATPAQFPGENGTVQYSEGLLVGYRWYDQQGIQPMFPFGFGLSYTQFGYSNLQVASQVDGTTPVGVTATVTNEGSVAGSDVAQLYLQFPAAAGEPPRKLVGFQRVTLAPGQSTTVQFTINPRDEWWWNNGKWNETPGAYGVYVGNSSALSDLTLTGSYTMTQGIGNRAVTVTAPATFPQGATQTVSVALSAGGNQTVSAVNLSLAAPGGWTVTPLGTSSRTDVLPGQAIAQSFAVTPPAGAVTQDATLFGTANFSPSACASQSSAISVATGTQDDDPVAVYKAVLQGAPDCISVLRQNGVRIRLKP